MNTGRQGPLGAILEAAHHDMVRINISDEDYFLCPVHSRGFTCVTANIACNLPCQVSIILINL